MKPAITKLLNNKKKRNANIWVLCLAGKRKKKHLGSPLKFVKVYFIKSYLAGIEEAFLCFKSFGKFTQLKASSVKLHYILIRAWKPLPKE